MVPASDPSQHVGGPTVDRCGHDRRRGCDRSAARVRCSGATGEGARSPSTGRPGPAPAPARPQARPAALGSRPGRHAGPSVGGLPVRPRTGYHSISIRLGGFAGCRSRAETRQVGRERGPAAGNRGEAPRVDLVRRQHAGARPPLSWLRRDRNHPSAPGRWTEARANAPSGGGAGKLCPWGRPRRSYSCIVLLRRPPSSAKSPMSRRTTSPPRGHRPPEETGRGRCDTV